MKRMKCWPIDATVQRARRLVGRINPIDSDWNLPENQQSSANDQFPALESPSLSGPLKTVLFLQFLYFIIWKEGEKKKKRLKWPVITVQPMIIDFWLCLQATHIKVASAADPSFHRPHFRLQFLQLFVQNQKLISVCLGAGFFLIC